MIQKIKNQADNFCIMKRVKYLLVAAVTVFVYVILSVTAGQNSFASFDNLNEQKKEIAKRVSDIESINDELKLEYYALQNDKAVIAAYAHKLDYVSDGEKLVKVNGLTPFQTNIYDTGTVKKHTEPEFLSEKTIKIISLCAGLLALVVIFMIDLSFGRFSSKKNNKTVVKGIPIYDLQQI